MKNVWWKLIKIGVRVEICDGNVIGFVRVETSDENGYEASTDTDSNSNSDYDYDSDISRSRSI